MITIKDKHIDYSEYSNEKFLDLYQPNLTNDLDRKTNNFDQDTINEIVLWKVNRYAKISDETLDMLNKISWKDKIINTALTEKILESLLNTKGIRLPMASTILRFKNSNIYQIIDQRVYRFLYGEDIKYPHNIQKQIKLYLEYLDKLNRECKKANINFNCSDRILYLADKKLNSDAKLKNYGSN